jgi:hypothetical protein
MSRTPIFAAHGITRDTPMQQGDSVTSELFLTATYIVSEAVDKLFELAEQMDEANGGEVGAMALLSRIANINSKLMSFFDSSGDEYPLYVLANVVHPRRRQAEAVLEKLINDSNKQSAHSQPNCSDEQATWEAGREHAAAMFRKFQEVIDTGIGDRMSESADYRGDYETLEQLNVTRPFLEQMVIDPSLIPGFSAVLTGLIGADAQGFGTPDLAAYGSQSYEGWKPKTPTMKPRRKPASRKAVAA